jgi:hypothetical protein
MRDGSGGAERPAFGFHDKRELSWTRLCKSFLEANFDDANRIGRSMSVSYVCSRTFSYHGSKVTVVIAQNADAFRSFLPEILVGKSAVILVLS